MRRDWLRDRPPRPWTKPSGIWGNLSLATDGIFAPKPKPGETTIEAVVKVPEQICKGLARRGHISRKQIENKDAVAIGNGLLKAVEKEVYGSVRSRRY